MGYPRRRPCLLRLVSGTWWTHSPDDDPSSTNHCSNVVHTARPFVPLGAVFRLALGYFKLVDLRCARQAASCMTTRPCRRASTGCSRCTRLCRCGKVRRKCGVESERNVWEQMAGSDKSESYLLRSGLVHRPSWMQHCHAIAPFWHPVAGCKTATY